MKTADAVTATATVLSDRRGDGYEEFLANLKRNFDIGEGPLFTTDAAGLWDTFLNNLPEEARQHYTCHACRHFVERFGGLVRIAADGAKSSAVWPDHVPTFFAPAIKAILKTIAKAKVNGVFVSSLKVYGQPVTGDWHHMAVTPKASCVWHSLVKSASQNAAEKLEEFKMLIAGLHEYSPAVVDQALKLLRSDALYRSEKVIGVAEWLKELHAKRATTKSRVNQDNITWLAVATAPAGFCHVKSTMIGTLLDDLAAGMDFDAVSKRFAAKMHPLQYLRPQAPPSAGNIAQAEKVMAQLGASGSLERRYARLDEIETIWKPKPAQERANGNPNGVFSHLVPKGQSDAKPEDVKAPTVTITWEKFNRTVLPGALKIEYYAGNQGSSYSAITTAANSDAPPIIKWDNEQQRNPFAWYLYPGGSSPQRWNLNPGWVNVTGICFSPWMWHDGRFTNEENAVHFILEGAKDTNAKNCGNALFPEILKSDLHGVRSTIEAYSRQARLSGYEDASACGVRGVGPNWNLLLRVTSDLGVSYYRLDRWD